MYKNETGIEILTPSGFQHFDGITKKKSNKLLKFIFSDTSDIVCTETHIFIDNGLEVLANSIQKNTILCDKYIIDILKITDNIDVFDLVNVGNGNLYITNDIISHNCNFSSSAYTLISGAKLESITTLNPVFTRDHLCVYIEPIKNHSYVVTVDTSEGIHQDYSAFTVFDITSLPYSVVATYKDNTISSLSYPNLIFQICQKYNQAYVLIETNSVGVTVANCIFYELEYENVYFTHKDTLNEGMGFPGVRTTKKVKAIGTACLRELVEQDQLIINSHEILAELAVFVRKGTSYASSEPNGVNDDLTSTLWLFAWLTKQPIFSELTNTNVRAILAAKMEAYINENMLPFGEMTDGSEDYEEPSQELDIRKYGGPKNDPMYNWIMS